MNARLVVGRHTAEVEWRGLLDARSLGWSATVEFVHGRGHSAGAPSMAPATKDAILNGPPCHPPRHDPEWGTQ